MQVSCDGTVAFRTGERIMFSYLVSQRFVGDKIPLTVLRNGKELDLEVRFFFFCAIHAYIHTFTQQCSVQEP